MNESLEEHVPRLYRFALRLTGDPETAADLTQEAFLRAWRKRAALRTPAAARVWLFRIAANLWRDQLRRGRSPVAEAGSLSDGQALDRDQPERRLAEREELERALRAMDGLPSRQREVLYLSACEGLTAQEVAQVLDINTDAVKANLCLARKRMREDLHDLFQDLFPAS